MLFKEALQNVVKHADASSVRVEVRYHAPQLTLTVRDDGNGFDGNRPDLGNGLVLMKQRAAKHKGTLQVSSTPGAGTTVRLSVRLR